MTLSPLASSSGPLDKVVTSPKERFSVTRQKSPSSSSSAKRPEKTTGWKSKASPTCPGGQSLGSGFVTGIQRPLSLAPHAEAAAFLLSDSHRAPTLQPNGGLPIPSHRFPMNSLLLPQTLRDSHICLPKRYLLHATHPA